MIDAVHHYDGYVVQSTGDGIFALFGAPVAHEDHPQRALLAALRMQEELRRYSVKVVADGSTPVQGRVGINTGEVVVRSIQTGAGQVEYTPIGHTTNLASRMQTAAPVGSVAVSEATRRLCEGYFILRPLGATRVKGVSEPVNVYEVTELGPIRTRLQRSAGRGLTKFVGRKREMEVLRHALDQGKAGHGQIVAAMADPGVGKSRLFYEFKAASQSGCMVLETFSVSHGKASAYLPVIDLLHGYFKITGDDDARTRREKVTGRVVALDRSLEDALPYLFALLGIVEDEDPLAEMDGQMRKRRTLEAIKRILLRESLNQSLMVTFEDLHWIDEQTQEFLNLLADSIATAKILLLVNYRPEYSHQWNSKTYYTQLRLDPLGQESAEEMLAALLGDGAELGPLKRVIIEKTEGTPFFMEETVQVLLDDGALVRNGTVKLIKPLAELKIPPTVQAILASRIDRLSRDAKELLQTLAVIGREFPLSLIRAVLSKSNDELNPLLDDLQLGEFIYEQPAVGDTEYIFKHALTQEVAYNSVLIERRREIHERSAASIEELFADKLDDHIDALAHHYSRGGNASKAVGFLRRAAEQARNRSAYKDALDYANEALRLLAEIPESLERDRDEIAIQGIRAVLLGATKGFAAAELAVCLNRGLELCERIGEGPEMFGVMFGLWNFNFARNRLPNAMKLAEKILNLTRFVSSETAEAGAHSAFGATCLWRGEFRAAHQHLEQANAIYDRDITRFLPMFQARVVPSRAQSSWASWMIGSPDQAYARAEEALALATRLGSPFSLVFALMHAIALAHLRGDYSVIRLRAETMMQIASEQGFPYWSAIASMVIGRVLVGEGNHDAGITRMRDAMATLRETGGELIYNYALSLLAESYLMAREPGNGLAVTAEAFEGIETSGQHMYEAELWRLRGELLVLRGGAETEAEHSFDRALRVARSQQARSWELRATTNLTRLLAKQGKRDEARTMLAEVYGWFIEGFDTADLKDAKTLLDELSA